MYIVFYTGVKVVTARTVDYTEFVCFSFKLYRSGADYYALQYGPFAARCIVISYNL